MVRSVVLLATKTSLLSFRSFRYHALDFLMLFRKSNVLLLILPPSLPPPLHSWENWKLIWMQNSESFYKSSSVIKYIRTEQWQKFSKLKVNEEWNLSLDFFFFSINLFRFIDWLNKSVSWATIEHATRVAQISKTVTSYHY